LILVFLEGSTDTVIYVHVTNINSKTYRNLQLESATQEGFRTTKEGEENEISQTLRIVIFHLTWYQRTNCTPSKLEISQEAFKDVYRRMSMLE